MNLTDRDKKRIQIMRQQYVETFQTEDLKFRQKVIHTARGEYNIDVSKPVDDILDPPDKQQADNEMKDDES